jgi:dienelactone hydrolase
MKYLVTTRRRDAAAVPPEARAGLLLAQRDWIEDRIGDGTFAVCYGFAQGGGAIAIVNADTGEQLNATLSDSPLFGISTFEIQPLADIRMTLGAASAALRRIAVPA